MGMLVLNRILLGLPNRGCDFIFSQLTFVDLRLHELLQEAGRDGFDFKRHERRQECRVGLAGWQGFSECH